MPMMIVVRAEEEVPTREVIVMVETDAYLGIEAADQPIDIVVDR